MCIFCPDYDRLHFCDKDTQRKYFERQLQVLGEATSLPLFLHSRAAADDFTRIVARNRDCISAGVVSIETQSVTFRNSLTHFLFLVQVHSFTGSKEEAQQILDLDLYIGINGWYAHPCLFTCDVTHAHLLVAARSRRRRTSRRCVRFRLSAS